MPLLWVRACASVFCQMNVKTHNIRIQISVSFWIHRKHDLIKEDMDVALKIVLSWLRQDFLLTWNEWKLAQYMHAEIDVLVRNTYVYHFISWAYLDLFARRMILISWIVFIFRRDREKSAREIMRGAVGIPLFECSQLVNLWRQYFKFKCIFLSFQFFFLG